MVATPAERLLTTADRLFYAEGIRSVGIDRVLAESGVAKASLYQHYGSKDALVAAYLARRVDDWHGFLDAAIERSDDAPAAQLLATFELLAAWMTEPGFRGCPFINAAAELPDPAHPGRAAVADHRTRTRARFVELAEQMGVAEPDELGASLVLVYDGALVAADLGSPDAAAATLLRVVRDLVEAAAPARGDPERDRWRSGQARARLDEARPTGGSSDGGH
jgi:AcrR family transcriptional regulator